MAGSLFPGGTGLMAGSPRPPGSLRSGPQARISWAVSTRVRVETRFPVRGYADGYGKCTTAGRGVATRRRDLGRVQVGKRFPVRGYADG